jgi:hypothetical protein
LEQRRQAVEARFQELDAVPNEVLQSHLTIEYLHHYYGSELEWLAVVIDRLRATNRSDKQV